MPQPSTARKPFSKSPFLINSPLLELPANVLTMPVTSISANATVSARNRVRLEFSTMLLLKKSETEKESDYDIKFIITVF
jgi:hypothetical protein